MYASFNARALGLAIPAQDAIDLAARAGFAGVDLMVRDLVDAGSDPKLLRSRMDDLGLSGGAWPLPVDWRGDSAQFQRDLARLPRLAEAAATLGLTRTGTWVMPETSARPESGTSRSAHLAQFAAFHRERLSAIAGVLAGYGVRLGLEVIGVESSRTGRGTPFIARLGDLDRWLGRLLDEQANVGILIDAFHLFAARETVEAGLAWGVQRVVWVHLADLPASALPDPQAIRDEDRGLPGETGAIDCRGVLQRLEEAGYEGPVTAEPLAGNLSLQGLNNEAAAQRVAAALRSVWPRGSQTTTREGGTSALSG